MTLLALSGGVGGAKLVSGLAASARARDVLAIVNVGDDFDHLSLRICPDIDSVLYAAAGMNDTQRGWGRAGETWAFHEALPGWGYTPWFLLGDRDLATHVLRTHWIREGQTLSQVTARMAEAQGLPIRVAPVTDDALRTRILTPEGELPFQDWFVRLRCEPVCRGIRFDGASQAQPSTPLAEALAGDGPEGFIVCPSNPFVSVEPLLAVAALREAIAARRVPCVAVSPIVGGQAVKGPAAKMMAELGLPVSALGVAQRYRGRIDGLLLDMRDAEQAPAIEALGLHVRVADTLMTDATARLRVAEETLALLDDCRRA